ncbi:MAG: 50S ribosomal protein bL37 [Planctomycetaceae bacterium]
MARNSRRIKKANHGKRPCAHHGRRLKSVKTPR